MNELTEERIKEIVKDTVLEMRRNGLLRRADDVAYSEISSQLFEYYKDPDAYPELQPILEIIKGDMYFDILPFYYRERYTIDVIAEVFGCEISTVTRNKKRLCLKVYNALH